MVGRGMIELRSWWEEKRKGERKKDANEAEEEAESRTNQNWHWESDDQVM
jgi:hypothetical protein